MGNKLFSPHGQYPLQYQRSLHLNRTAAALSGSKRPLR